MFVQWILKRNQSYNIEIIHSIYDHLSNFQFFFIIKKIYKFQAEAFYQSSWYQLHKEKNTMITL